MMKNKDGVNIFTKEEIAYMTQSGQLVAQVLDMITQYVDPGVTTNYLDKLCYEMILDNNAQAGCLGYKGYPKTICTSINEVVCHGIPNEKTLKDGDILNIDLTVILNGWYGDSSRMFWVGQPAQNAKKLSINTYKAMMEGIAQIKPGATVGDIGHAIEKYALSFGYSVVRDYCGHGIGTEMHTAPSILHYGRPGSGIMLEEGMIFTVEPMINLGQHHTKLSKKDGWTVTTKDRSLSAQFEHTVVVTSNGYEIITQSPQSLHFPPYTISKN